MFIVPIVITMSRDVNIYGYEFMVLCSLLTTVPFVTMSIRSFTLVRTSHHLTSGSNW